VESIDLSPSFGCKGGMLFDGVWMISINPEDRIIETIADAVSRRITMGTVAPVVRPPSRL